VGPKVDEAGTEQKGNSMDVGLGRRPRLPLRRPKETRNNSTLPHVYRSYWAERLASISRSPGYQLDIRLRLRHGETWKTAGRPALVTQLHEAINDKSVKARSGLTKGSLEASRDRARALHVLFTKLEGMSDLHAETAEAHEVVGEIVKQAHEFPLATLSAALQSSC
jgi:hypothetical protein